MDDRVQVLRTELFQAAREYERVAEHGSLSDMMGACRRLERAADGWACRPGGPGGERRDGTDRRAG